MHILIGAIGAETQWRMFQSLNEEDSIISRLFQNQPRLASSQLFGISWSESIPLNGAMQDQAT